MDAAGVIATDVVGVIGLIVIIQLVRRNLLTIEFGVSWITTIAVAMLVVTIPPLRHFWTAMSNVLFESPPYVIALVLFLLLFLLYLSVLVSILQRRVREISQFISLEIRVDVDDNHEAKQR